MVFDSRNSAAGWKKVVELMTKMSVDLTGFNSAAVLKKVQLDAFQAAVQVINNSVRDRDIDVKSREDTLRRTWWAARTYVCPRSTRTTVDAFVGYIPLLTPGANVGTGPTAREAVPFSLQRQGHLEHTDPHHPAVARGERQAQGIMHDNLIAATVSDKSRFFMHLWDPVMYPFACGLECPTRQAARKLAFEHAGGRRPERRGHDARQDCGGSVQ